jgi:hypothetical protein
MARRWKCARCSHENDEALISCGNCGLIRGAAFSTEVGQSAGSATPPPAPRFEAPTSPVPAPHFSDPTANAAASDQPELRAQGSETPPPGAIPPVQWDPDDLGVGAPAEPKKPLWRRIPPAAFLWIILIGGGAIGGLIFNASRNPSGEINKSGDLTAADLRVGDCFDLKDPSAEEIDKVNALPCGQEHEYELFFTGSMPTGDYPADPAFESYVETNCVPAFEAYLGRSYQTSEYDFFWLVPTSAAWGDGDRSIQCAAFHPRIHRLTESVKGLNR